MGNLVRVRNRPKTLQQVKTAFHALIRAYTVTDSCYPGGQLTGNQPHSVQRPNRSCAARLFLLPLQGMTRVLRCG